MQPKKTNSSFLYLALLLLLLSLGIALFVRSDFFAITDVQALNLTNIQASDVEQLSAGIMGQNLLLFDAADLERKLKLHPLVKSVDLERKLPHTLQIKLTERKPLALISVSNGVIEIDEEGVFLRRTEAWPGSYPVLAGLEVPDTAGPGQVLQNKDLSVVLNFLGQAPEDLRSMMGEVYINSAQQITVFLTNGVEVRLGHAQTWAGKLASLWELLNDEDFNAVEQSVRYIDFTAAKPVIGR